jgi:hypothetical protein
MPSPTHARSAPQKRLHSVGCCVSPAGPALANSAVMEPGHCRLDPDSPLITPPDPSTWLVVPEHDNFLLDALEQVIDTQILSEVTWPARDGSGRLAPPPDCHFLDQLVRGHDLLGEADEHYHVEVVGQGAQTVAELLRGEACDLCRGHGRYSARIWWQGRRQHGVLCAACYDQHGDGQLGGTRDWFLFTLDDVPARVQEVCDVLTGRLDRDSLWS